MYGGLVDIGKDIRLGLVGRVRGEKTDAESLVGLTILVIVCGRGKRIER